MLFAKTLAVAASFVVAVLAQQSRISFTNTPTAAKAGVPTDLKWTGGNNSPVTITLKQGDPGNLQDVDVLTTTGTAGSFTWTPSKSLPDGNDYALQIAQEGSEDNFSGLFSISGGSGATPASVSKSSSASVTKSPSASVTVPATTLSLTLSKNNTIVATTKIPFNGTIPIPGTAASFGSSGISISRNGTLSRATLTATKSSTTSSSAPGSGSSGSTGGSSAGSSPSPSSTPGSSAANLASPLALVLGAFLAVVYLG